VSKRSTRQLTSALIHSRFCPLDQQSGDSMNGC
jgi:hypothetical protein